MNGTVFGKLTVVEELAARIMPSGSKRMVRVRCSCSNEQIVQLGNLKSGRTTQCKTCANRSRRGKGQRNDDSVNRFQCFRNYQRAASRRGLAFDLTLEQFGGLTEQKCHYCSEAPSNVFNLKYKNSEETRGGLPFIYNGIDRVDSTQGYSIGNCVSSCRRCNLAKNDMSLIEFKTWLSAAYTHTIGE